MGYSHSPLTDEEDGGQKMMAAPFSSINGDGFWLTDLIPTGYKGNTDLIRGRGTFGDFNIQLLDSQGSTAIMEDGETLYMWSWAEDCDRNTSTWYDNGHWNSPGGHEIVPHSEDDHFFKRGEGLYFGSAAKSKSDRSATYSCLNSGEVDKSDCLIVLAYDDGGTIAVGNPFPVAVKLSTIIPTGYKGNTDLIRGRGTFGDFSVQVLDAQGGTTVMEDGETLVMYSWSENCDRSSGTWYEDGCWNDPFGHEIQPDPETGFAENDLTIEPGMGLWVSSAQKSSKEGEDVKYTMTIKYPVAK